MLLLSGNVPEKSDLCAKSTVKRKAYGQSLKTGHTLFYTFYKAKKDSPSISFAGILIF